MAAGGKQTTMGIGVAPRPAALEVASHDVLPEASMLPIF